MRFGWMRTVVVLAVLGLVAAACAKTVKAGSTGGTPTATPTSSSAPVTLSGVVTDKGTKDLSSQGQTIDVSIEADNESTSEYYFDPTFLKAMPGARVTVHLENVGSFPHNFSIESLHINRDLAKGQKATVTFTLPASGVVNFFCEYHHAKGMQGAFFFAAGQTAPATTTPASSGGGYGY